MKDIFYEYFHDKGTELCVSEGKSGMCRSHFHRSIEILYVMEGGMRTEVNGKEYLAETDDIVFVHGYYTHAFKPEPFYRKVFFVIPSNYGNDFDAIFQRSSLPPILDDKDFNRENLRDLFQKMYDERETMPPLVKKGYLNVALGSIIDRYPLLPLEKNEGVDMLVGVLNYIDINYASPITLDAISETFGYNKYYFSRLFNKYVGENLNNYVNIIRLQHFMSAAKKEENTPISELAFSCGFDSLTTFYRYFGKIYGASPKQVLSGSR